MAKMTYERLSEYVNIANQIHFLENALMPEQLRALDTTKPFVQSNSISNPTEDIALKHITIGEELNRLKKELYELDAFIYGIKDEFTKAIAIQKFIYREPYSYIAYNLCSNRRKVSETLRSYIENSA